MSIQKAQTGVTGTNKMSPNLKSYAGLKSKINQLNNEEKKNNQKFKSRNDNRLKFSKVSWLGDTIE